MTLYRILVDLDIRKKGGIDPLTGVKPQAIDRLLAGGFIAPLSAPPLAILDGWEKRAARLAKCDVQDAGQLLEANAADLARKLHVKAATIEAWKLEVKSWLCPA